MKRKYKFFSIIFVGGLLTACSSDEPGGTKLLPGQYPLKVNATIDVPQSRSAGKDYWIGDGTESFGMRIGSDGRVVEYVITDAAGKAEASAESNPLYWDNTSQATVSAWLPFNTQTDVDISDQSDGFATYDYLAATAEGQSYLAPVKLQFKHKMAKIRCILKPGKGITEADLKAASVKIFGFTSVTFTEGVVTGSGNGWITPDSDHEAVVAPQNLTGKGFISIEMNGQEYIYTPASDNAGLLKEGLLHQYTIILNANGIEVSAATGGEWTEGGSEDVASKEVKQTFTASDLKLGDYYYSDGTWSDGGLRKLYSDGTMKWAETTPQPESNKTCIGIVFYAGQHETDTGDYTATGIGQSQCRGYVVALTDVNNGERDRLCWESGPDNQDDLLVGTIRSYDDWNGFTNNQKFHEFVEEPNNKYAGWEMKHFPASFACETYGKRTSDPNGNDANGKYDWQHPLAAPSNTTGWFLPSCGQLKYLYENRSLLSPCMDVVKSSIPDNCNYKNKIKWFSSTFPLYWSSTEDPRDPDIASHVNFNDGFHYYDVKFETNAVRAVLAF